MPEGVKQCGIAAQLAVGARDQEDRREERQRVGDGNGVQHAVEPEEHREQQRESHSEDDLADHGQGRGRGRLAHGLQKDEAGLVDTGQNDHAQVDAEGLHGKVCVVDALVGSTEQGDQLPREALYQHQRKKA